ncbi:MAG: DUF3147 family protein [Candidatus Riflebacteria bacterium]|nr:DUF3147 family protein [Candidatus Riflebacteria bacterium]
MQYFIKILVTAIIVVSISELSKRHQTAGAILASLPTTTILALIWLYYDTQDNVRVANLTTEIMLMVVPSLVFFLALPIFLKKDFSFWVSLGASSAITSICYFIFYKVISIFTK